MLGQLVRRVQGIPSGPFYYGVSRGDHPPMPPMSDGYDGLDDPPGARPAIRPPAVDRGYLLGFRQLSSHPEELRGGLSWPVRLYALENLVGTRKGEDGAVWTDQATIGDEVPGWRFFGPHGDGVPEVLEAIWTLDPARVSALLVPTERGGVPVPRGRIPIDTLAPPTSDQRGTTNAIWEVMTFLESKSWTAHAGGDFSYSGCYFVYRVSDPHWLVAMGLAINAVVALTSGPAIDRSVRASALQAWEAVAS